MRSVSTTPFLWLDSGVHTADPIHPLVLDEALASMMSRPDSVPLIHLWMYDKALFLGRRDAKLPHLKTALRLIGMEGYDAVLRASGGACVPLDAGVLNIAFLLPDTTISIDSFFKLAATMLQEGLRPFAEISFGEVAGSYCAGEYDFSYRGKKIGGMAQRRTRHGSLLQLMINVDSKPRGTLMERFYDAAGLADMPENKPIPSLDGSTVGSLAESSGIALSIEEVKQRFFQTLGEHWSITPTAFPEMPEAIQSARHHLLDKLSLFSYKAEELLSPDWHLPY